MSAVRMLFHRDFRGYTGGHGKVWDYFNHALALGFDARVYLTPESLRDAGNPWMALPERIEPRWQPRLPADVLFVAGMDWQAVPADAPGARVVNLVQGLRHADAGLPLRAFLSRPAARICVSQAVADAIVASGEVNGEVRVIAAALNLPDVRRQADARDTVLIAALKNPQIGREVAALLRRQGHRVELLDACLPRDEFLAALARARIAVMLPYRHEGFFLPGLEAMALGCAVAMPACAGNAEYALDGGNCLMPEADAQALAAAVQHLHDDTALQSRLIAAGCITASRHTLAAERAAFAEFLRGLLP